VPLSMKSIATHRFQSGLRLLAKPDGLVEPAIQAGKDRMTGSDLAMGRSYSAGTQRATWQERAKLAAP
jgi:hypothetical protein